MSARPGSALWLLRHELRLFWYNLSPAKKGKAPRRAGWTGLASWAVVWLLLHALFFALLYFNGDRPFPEGLLLLGISAALVAASLFMLSSGLKASVEVLFDRGDLDLLLSSPLPSRSIFAVRLAGIAIGVASLYLFLLTPLAHAGLLLGQFHWLGIYPTILGVAAIASSAAMLLTLGLVRLLGARRTRVVAQVIGALAGALLFLMGQAGNFVNQDGKGRTAQWLTQFLAAAREAHPDGLIWLPARAALGEPAALACLSLVAGAIMFFTVHFTHRFFVHGLQQAASTSRAARRPAAGVRYRFGGSLANVVLVKEWRLILRDPHLISQVLLQLLYMIPLVILMFKKPDTPAPGIGTSLTLLCGSLTASLAWIAIQAEDAPDLLLASPANPATIRYAKLAAAVMPTIALVALPLLWLVAHYPLAGVLTCFTVVGSTLHAGLVVMWCGIPGTRSDFKRRAKRSLLGGLFEVTGMFAWGGLAFLLLTSTAVRAPSDLMACGAAGLFALVLILPFGAWLARRRPG